MADLQVTNTFVDGDVVSATNFNTNYSDIVTYVNNRNSAAATWDAIYSTHGTNVPLTVNNSTGTQDIVQMKDNGTNVLQIPDGGIVNMPLQDFAHARKSGIDVYLGSGATKITTWSVQSQTQSNMDSTGKFTADSSGKYLISVLVDRVTLSGTELVTLYIYVNGSAVAKSIGTSSATVSESWSISDIRNLSANDYVEIYGSAPSGFAVGDGTGTIFSVMKLS